MAAPHEGEVHQQGVPGVAVPAAEAVELHSASLGEKHCTSFPNFLFLIFDTFETACFLSVLPPPRDNSRMTFEKGRSASMSHMYVQYVCCKLKDQELQTWNVL